MTPGTRIGSYNIVSQLASSEKGEVYQARDTQRHRQVALRVLPDSLSRLPDRLRCGEKEALAVSELNHPNIAVVYEYGQEGGIHFIASEFNVGETLRESLRLHRGRPPERGREEAPAKDRIRVDGAVPASAGRIDVQGNSAGDHDQRAGDAAAGLLANHRRSGAGGQGPRHLGRAHPGHLRASCSPCR